MNKTTRHFIRNADKSLKSNVVYYNAHTSKPDIERYHWADDLTVKPSTVWIVVAVVVFGIFALAVYNGY